MLEKDLCDHPKEEGSYIAIFKENSSYENWDIGQVYFSGGVFTCSLYSRDEYPVQVKSWLPMPKIDDFK